MTCQKSLYFTLDYVKTRYKIGYEPKEWRRATFIPIFKKENRDDCNNGGISSEMKNYTGYSSHYNKQRRTTAKYILQTLDEIPPKSISLLGKCNMRPNEWSPLLYVFFMARECL